MKVVHQLPGRIRIELANLYGNQKLAVLLEHDLAQTAGVIQVKASHTTGRLLVHYAPYLGIDIKKIKQLVQRVLKASTLKPILRWQNKKMDKNNPVHEAYELEGLPIRRQLFFTGASGLLLLQSFLKLKTTPYQQNKTNADFDVDTALSLLTGYPVFRTAIEHLLKKGRVSSELLATVAAIISLANKQSRMSLLVITLIYLNTLLRTLAAEKARDRMRDMLAGKAPTARVITPGGLLVVPGHQVAPGAKVLVQNGERLPVDGSITWGTGLISQCPVPGENKLVRVAPGDFVYAGGMVIDGQLETIARRVGEQTRIGRVIQTLQRKPYTQADVNVQVLRLMHQISVVSLVTATVVYLMTRDVGRAVAILIVGSPGAAGMAMSMPLGTAVGQGAARGMLVKKSKHLARLGQADTVLFHQNTFLNRPRDERQETIAMLEEVKIAQVGLLNGQPQQPTKIKNLSTGIAVKWLHCPVEEKVKVIQKLKQQNKIVAMVGDGVSDVPALAAADVGITLSKGDYLDLESAHMVIDSNDIRQVAHLVRLAQQSLQVARQNIYVSVGTNIVGVGFGALSLLSPLTMAILQNMSTFWIMFNSGRLLFPNPFQVQKKRLVAQQAATALTLPAAARAKAPSIKTTSWPERFHHRVGNQKMRQVKPAIANFSARPYNHQGWETVPLNDVLDNLKTNPRQGLTLADAAARVNIYGYNLIPQGPSVCAWHILKRQMKSYMSKVLLGIAAISLLLGKQSNAIMSSGVLLANTTLAVLQQRRMEKSLTMLGQYVLPKSQVLRDESVKTIDAKYLVPGDILLLEAGDQIPADARIIKAERLTVEEASLTGESWPVLKQTSALGRSNMLYGGTGVLSGRAKAVVVRTGTNTELGEIAGAIQVKDSFLVPMPGHIDELGVILVRGGVLVSGLALLAGLWHGQGIHNIIVNAINLAVSVIPDGLAPTITMAMALGALRLSKQKVLVRQLEAIHRLGCVSVICCDKTGTLTLNQMTVREVLCGKSHLFVSLGESFSLAHLPDRHALKQLCQVAYLCNNARQLGLASDGAWQLEGDSTECGIMQVTLQSGFSQQELAGGMIRIEEIPFDAGQMCMTVICQDKNSQRMSFVKGAPEVILNKCMSININGRVTPLDDKTKQQINNYIQNMSQRALRVIGLAYKKINENSAPDEGLVFAGLMGLYDPPRPGIKKALEKCRRAGVRVVMITGDYPRTALAVAQEVGLAAKGDPVITGAQIEGLGEDELADMVKEKSVYARITPKQKLRLVQAMQKQGMLVAMVGDGVNDLSAVKAAQVGVAMGKSGAAVTKEVAEITLADDNMAMLPEAMQEGRVFYDNIRQCLRYLMATNLGDGFVILATALGGKPMPINPLQLLWINLAGDPLVTWALANKIPKKGIMNQPPYQYNVGICNDGLGGRIISRSIAQGLSALLVYHSALKNGHTMALTRSQTMITLGLSRVWHLLDYINLKDISKEQKRSNKSVATGGLVLLASLLGAVYLPFVRQILNTTPLNRQQWLSPILWSGLGYGLDTLWQKRDKGIVDCTLFHH